MSSAEKHFGSQNVCVDWLTKKIKARLNEEATLLVNKYVKLSHLGPMFLHSLFFKKCYPPKMILYYFPVAAATYYHKFSGLKQHKYTLPQFWKPEG